MRVRKELKARQRVMSSRWVLTWKCFVDTGLKGVKARLCLRGFLDIQSAILAVAAATASLLSHRIFCATATNAACRIVSHDVGAAFMQGSTFAEFEGQKGEVRREVFADLPAVEDYQLLHEICPDSFSLLLTHFVELLVPWLLKGGDGLKDAPRLW